MGSSYDKPELSDPEGFRQALYHLRDEALAAGWTVPAHFIDVATEAMQVHIFESSINPARGIPVTVAGTAPAQENDESPKPS